MPLIPGTGKGMGSVRSRAAGTFPHTAGCGLPAARMCGSGFPAFRCGMVRDWYPVLDQVLNRLVVQVRLAVTREMLEMGFDDGNSLFYDHCHHRLLVIWHGFALDDADRTLRAGADAGTEAVAEEVAHEPCLPVKDLECPFRAVRDALAASRALLFIDADDLTLHVLLPPYLILRIAVVRFSHAVLLIPFSVTICRGRRGNFSLTGIPGIQTEHTHTGNPAEIQKPAYYTVTPRNTRTQTTSTMIPSSARSTICITGTTPASADRIASMAKLSGFTAAMDLSQPGMTL